MLTVVSGSIFDHFNDQTALVNPVNCEGVMGAGLAKVFKAQFPENFLAYRDACGGTVAPGECVVFQLKTPGYQERFIINLMTKDKWREPSQYHWIHSGLCRIQEWARHHPTVTIVSPMLGCGLGGLNPAIVKEMFLVVCAKNPNLRLTLCEN